jgi:hypothetical protein
VRRSTGKSGFKTAYEAYSFREKNMPTKMKKIFEN